MRMLVTKVSNAKLSVDNTLISSIGEGYVVYFGVKDTDTEDLVDKCVRKITNLRIYHDEQDKLNLKLDKDKQEILVVSQFTLYGDVTNNNRPDRKSTRLNSSHVRISYAVFCLKKKKK